MCSLLFWIYISIHYFEFTSKLYTTNQKFGMSKIFLINEFIQQEPIKLIESDN